jgi:hypothetical protein
LELKISAVVVDIIKVSIDGGSTEGEDSIDGGSTEGEDTHRPSKRDFYRVEKHTPPAAVCHASAQGLTLNRLLIDLDPPPRSAELASYRIMWRRV